MNIGFDLDRIFINTPPFIPYKIIELFYRKKVTKDKLGFILAKKFTNYPFLMSDDIADESFQSYDHPPVLIFKNTKKLSKTILKTIIENKE